MSKTDEKIDEEVSVEAPKKAKEDAAHVAYREMLELYAKQNPTKFAAKEAEFAKKLAGKISFVVTEDGRVLDGRVDPVNNKKAPIEFVFN